MKQRVEAPMSAKCSAHFERFCRYMFDQIMYQFTGDEVKYTEEVKQAEFKDINEEDLVLSPLAFVPFTDLVTSSHVPIDSSQNAEDRNSKVPFIIQRRWTLKSIS
ncbi:hypothetical protein F2Q69_00048417 [Brassica cretica]|uniref:Uncharacterized protein n=1 Tax=Brassica cretica TaxID=69181 RepID=A0A8S9Q0N2_BRACR|nr:hypothetical protein F2Q69_00048417 [Brassica cretica]